MITIIFSTQNFFTAAWNKRLLIQFNVDLYEVEPIKEFKKYAQQFLDMVAY